MKRLSMIITGAVSFCVIVTSSDALLSPTASFAQQPDQRNAGKPHRTTAQGQRKCLEAAKDTLLEERNSVKLCAGATSRAPVSCFERADELTLLQESLLVDLCTCATSTAPADCYVATDEKLDLSEREIVVMCNAC